MIRRLAVACSRPSAAQRILFYGQPACRRPDWGTRVAAESFIAEIAYATGIASQSLMTDPFRSLLGRTPGRYRRDTAP